MDLNKVRAIKGLEWTGFAIGNAQWSGVKLRDVLLYAGKESGKKEYIINRI